VAYASGDVKSGANGDGMNWFWNGRDYSLSKVITFMSSSELNYSKPHPISVAA
jgi:hypothetical protein